MRRIQSIHEKEKEKSMKTLITSYEANALFTARAVSDDETRYYMMHCECVEYNGEKCLVATDGRRLHIAPATHGDFEVGHGYKPVKVTKKSVDYVSVEQDYQFPNFERVIPDEFHGADSDYPPVEIVIQSLKKLL